MRHCFTSEPVAQTPATAGAQLRLGHRLPVNREADAGYNFRPVERDQHYLLPASVRDWLPEDVSRQVRARRGRAARPRADPSPASRVRKLWTGVPPGSRWGWALRSAAAERWAGAIGSTRARAGPRRGAGAAPRPAQDATGRSARAGTGRRGPGPVARPNDGSGGWRDRPP